MEEWKKCTTLEAKREFELKLATDKIASFIRVTQTESLKSQSEVSDVTGWLHIWEVAVEKFPHRPSDQDMVATLMRFESDCLSRPSEKPELAADEELQYDCRKKQVTKHSVARSSEVAAKSETTTDEQGFQEAKDAINAEARATLMSTKTKSKKSRSSTPRGFSGRRQSRHSAFEESALDESCERNKVGEDLEKAVEQCETAVKIGKGSAMFVSKSYMMRGCGKALETWKTKIVKDLANVENLTDDSQRHRPPLSCLCCKTLHT